MRKTDDTNRDSTFAELQSAMNRIYTDADGKNHAEKYWKITLNPLMMENRVTGSRIIFRGMNDTKQREKVKSITVKIGKLTWIWVEEATELSEEDIDILDDRLRGKLPSNNLYYQMTLTFNPVSAEHWIKSKFFDIVNQDVFTHHSTYLDNRFGDSAFHRRMMMRKERDFEGYRIYGLGEWGETEGIIFPNNWRAITAPKDLDWYDSISLGQDFGFNHANCILLLGIKDNQIYIIREMYLHEMDSNDIIMEAENWLDKATMERIKKTTMYCDSAEPDRIQMWRKAGYRAVPCTKGQGSVVARIDWLKQRNIFIDGSCVNTIKEISQYRWKNDKITNKYTDEPIDVFDDAIASLRYGIEQWFIRNTVNPKKDNSSTELQKHRAKILKNKNRRR